MEDVAPEVLFEASANLNQHKNTDITQQLAKEIISLNLGNMNLSFLSDLLQEIVDQIQISEKKKKSIWMDIRVIKSEDGWKILLRNDGTIFNPVEKLSERFSVLKDQISYTSVLSLNQIQIEINHKAII